ncbi:MAG: LysM peptidoglycan-binding domain-containing protein [Rhodobacteraceae bacterium]|nr:LysM peptidoglycan-binding domain-containing protein [Paracoccaceae bacterium]MCW9041950.1 LysM peptidoglycan-binding domain-containing protein [Pseudopelagicola sp.]
MSKIASFLSGNIGVVGGAAAVVVAGVAAAIIGGVFDREPPAPEATTLAAPKTETPAVGAEPEAAVSAAPVAAVAEPIRPAFDVVRSEVDGTTLIAGQGAAKAEITVLLDEADLVAAKTDSTGKFAVFAMIAPSTSPRILQLVHRRDGGDVFSEATVILAPTPETETLAETGATSQEAVEASAEPVAPTVLLQTRDGVSVLQSAATLAKAPEIMANVALDAISYSDAGEVELSGRGGEDRFVRAYLDNSPITTSRIEEGGNWRMQLPSVDTGVYTLRVDEVDEDGTVVSRVETPFKREDQAVLAAAPALDAPAKVVTVQPGSTLWAIAAERYGSGTMYIRVFEANKDRIKNPDLIFPGQVFDIPR